jgi:carbon storage regulator CsrA
MSTHYSVYLRTLEAPLVLILTRRPREVVLIGHDVQVMILDIDGDRIRLGITAPRELKILRHELRPFPPQPVSSTPAP